MVPPSPSCWCTECLLEGGRGLVPLLQLQGPLPPAREQESEASFPDSTVVFGVWERNTLGRQDHTLNYNNNFTLTGTLAINSD